MEICDIWFVTNTHTLFYQDIHRSRFSQHQEATQVKSNLWFSSPLGRTQELLTDDRSLTYWLDNKGPNVRSLWYSVTVCESIWFELLMWTRCVLSERCFLNQDKAESETIRFRCLSNCFWWSVLWNALLESNIKTCQHVSFFSSIALYRWLVNEIPCFSAMEFFCFHSGEQMLLNVRRRCRR